jgi:hypothetical protein
MKENKILYMILGLGVGIGVYYFLCNRLKKELESTQK